MDLKNGGSYPRMTAQQVEREPLDKLALLFGGKVSGPLHRENRKPIYYWELYGFAKTQNAVAQMWTWLSPRRRIQFANVILAHHGQYYAAGRVFQLPA